MTLAGWVNPGIEQRTLQIKDLTEKLEAALKEVERLKIHTWQQERAAIVALAAGWIDAMSPSPNEPNECMAARCEVLSELICIIERGED